MARHKSSLAEQEPETVPALEEQTNNPGAADSANGEELRGLPQETYTDKKGLAWKRLIASRYLTARKRLEQLITLGNWSNYHYTQREARAVCKRLRAIISRIEAAHSHTSEAEESPLEKPWED